MAKWAVKDKAEFEERQGCFDFGAACRFVAEMAASVRASLSGWWNKVRPVAPKALFKKPHQLVLELDSLAQIPMLF